MNTDRVSKTLQKSNFMTIGLVRAELFDVDGRSGGQT